MGLNLGLIAGVYVIFRCVEVLCASESRFSSRLTYWIARFTGATAIIITAVLMLNLLVGSVTVTASLP